MENILGPVEKLSVWGYLVRTLIIGLLIYFMSKLLPRRAGGQYSAYDFTFFWLMGGLVVSPLATSKVAVSNMLAAVVTVYMWHYIHSYLVVKSRRLARLLVGRPAILIENGRISKEKMRENLFNLELLMSQLRYMRAANPNQVAYATLETNGQLSVVKKSSAQPVTPSDLKIPVTKTMMPVVLVNDGRIETENLQGIGWDLDKLRDELGKKGVGRLEDVYLAVIDAVGELYYATK
ncbi:YetF domain-containing protein [Effusibacillus consociatus]|uniref:YetF domain-containing protein n=1 Tax=Effusibacillus consociatus TaxID=1117041 RepID=A0ABV9Q534_9BACL